MFDDALWDDIFDELQWPPPPAPPDLPGSPLPADDGEEPAAAAGAGAYGMGVAHMRFETPLPSNEFAIIKCDEEMKIMAGHCNYPGHGIYCRLNRATRPHAKGRKEAQGRPLGLILAWLGCADQFANQKDHHAITVGPNALIAPQLSFESRQHVRAALEAAQPGTYAALTALERRRRGGEGIEPGAVP